MLNLLITSGQRIEYGEKIGRTIVFAKKHNHAEKILEVWSKEYPDYPSHYARVIDDFSDKSKMPQIAMFVDMLDTGIDVPESLNLVFLKKC